MIICSCNVLSDQDVRSAVEAERTRSTSRVYGCLGRSAQCGGCARTIRRVVDEVLGSVRLLQWLREVFATLARPPPPGLGDHQHDRKLRYCGHGLKISEARGRGGT